MQITLVNVMSKIQDHMMQNGDQDNTSNVGEKQLASESIPSQVGPLGETLETSVSYERSFQEGLEAQLKQMKERYLEGFLVRQEITEEGPVLILTEPIILQVRAPYLQN